MAHHSAVMTANTEAYKGIRLSFAREQRNVNANVVSAVGDSHQRDGNPLRVPGEIAMDFSCEVLGFIDGFVPPTP
jgi:hypothetical protein